MPLIITSLTKQSSMFPTPLDEAEREFTIKQRLEYAKGQSWHYNSENHMLKRSVERSH